MSISDLGVLRSIVIITGIGSGNGKCEENIGGESFMSVTAIIRTRTEID
jgi:hypothetical protein